jgi:gamma-glutamyltranspeptidase/glutathione hydrolase/leukotriene-C4 hydrolase
VYQTLLNLDWSLDASQAVEYGRLHDQLYPLVTFADDVYPAHIVEDLRERGHNVTGTCSHCPFFVPPRAAWCDIGEYARWGLCSCLSLTYAVLDVNRVAAVVQLVVQQNGTIYGTCESGSLELPWVYSLLSCLGFQLQATQGRMALQLGTNSFSHARPFAA